MIDEYKFRNVCLYVSCDSTHGNELGKDETEDPHSADDPDPDELSLPASTCTSIAL